MRKLLSLSLSLSLALSAFGPGLACAQMVTQLAPVAPSAPMTAPVGQFGGISQGLQLSPSLAAPSLGANISLPITPSLRGAAPQAQTAALQAVQPVAANAAPVAARPVAAPAASASPMALPAAASKGHSTLRQAAQAAQPGEAQQAQTPFARTMEALSQKGPEYKEMSASESKDTAGKDFSARIGEDQGAAAVSAVDANGDVEVIAMAAEGSGRQLTQDVYPASMQPQMAAQRIDAMLTQQFGRLGISRSLLDVHGAKAVGAVAKINAAVIRVPAAQADSLLATLKGLGLDAMIGRRFSVPKPLDSEPSSKTVGLKETAKLTGADKLQDELKKVLGEPTPPAPAPKAETKPSLLSRIGTFIQNNYRKMVLGVAVTNPVLPWAILDSYAWVDHPFMKGRFLKSVSNDKDDQEHGTHTASTVVGMDIFNFHGRNYNIFPGGSASESDILFKLNMAQQDGALATTHSWGDGSGNPAGAIEKLFTKMAAEGVHHSISAGNSGQYGKNTVGGPAIAVQNADLAINGKVVGKVKRIKAIAASDSDKKTAYFSSRGPGSRTTSKDPQYKDWPQKPDEAGMGVNLVAAAPEGVGTANPDLAGGPGQSMSGTSMSNPGVFGAFMLLTRSILVLLADQLPKLPQKELTQLAMDLARYSMTMTDQKVATPDEVGDGFIDVWAAFQFASKTLKENAPAPKRFFASTHQMFRNLLGYAPQAAPTEKQQRVGGLIAGLGIGLPVLALQVTGILTHYTLTTLLGGGLLSAAIYGRQAWQRSEGQPLKERVIGTAAETFLAFTFGTAFVGSLVSQWAQRRFGPTVANWLARRQASRIPAAPRDISMTEFQILNGLGIVGSIAAGILMHAPLLGILGTFVAAIPLLYAYVGLRNLFGARIKVPGLRFDPSISFGGKQHHLFPKKD